ncbi:RTA1 like protein-domain-containing protein [Mycena sp. CBHHK59/15]|nr:RTA1 like protein-domain-containing protein [Mycena sp. CBHHK59/15]
MTGDLSNRFVRSLIFHFDVKAAPLSMPFLYHMVGPRSGSMAVEESQYGYIPQEYVAIIFLALFGISTILHIGQATYYRMWWLFPTACLCGLGELVGWSGRLWSSFSPSLNDPFMMQITCTIISPTPLIAVNFILLSWIVSRLGPCYARLTPIWYTIVFLSCDIVALVVQGAGGGIASTASDLSGTKLGSNIMLAGIVFQFATIIIYCCLAAEFLSRYRNNLPLKSTPSGRGMVDSKVQTMIGALAFSTLVLFIRSIYRIIELASGWNGRVFRTEVYFNVLDGGMVVLAIFTINIAHPGRLLGSQRPMSSVESSKGIL